MPRDQHYLKSTEIVTKDMPRAPRVPPIRSSSRTRPYTIVSTPTTTPSIPAHAPRQPLISPVTGDRTTSSAWSPSEDETLMQARAQGQNWGPIAHEYFPTKSPNACRKRHERLMEKRNNAENWDGVKVEVLAKAYLEIREQMWQLLAEKVNEKWSTVEEKCMEKGLKTLQNVGRSASKRHPSHPRDDPNPNPNPDNDDGGICPDPPRDSSEPDQSPTQRPAPTSTSEPTHHLRSLSGNSYPFPPSSSPYQTSHAAHSSYHSGPLPESTFRSPSSSTCRPSFSIGSSLPSTTTSLPPFTSLPSSSSLPSFPLTTTAGSQQVPSSRSGFEMPSIAAILHHGGSVSTY